MSNDRNAFSNPTPSHWRQEDPAAPPPGAQQWRRPSGLERFLGGAPTAVFAKLILVSLIVGALMMWLNLHPVDLMRAFSRLIDQIWALGFDTIREVGDYILAGAMLVIPIWLISRLLTMRRPLK